MVYLNAGRQDVRGSNAIGAEILPASVADSCPRQRSAQILRTCKSILDEARPILYHNTVFRSFFQAFAGRLPTCIAFDSSNQQHVKHIEWQLNCDILKRFNAKDVHITAQDVQALETVKISCQAENWRDSFCGEWTDREAFVIGRKQVVDFARLLQERMRANNSIVRLAEDTRFLSRGRVVLRLITGRATVNSDVSKAATA